MQVLLFTATMPDSLQQEANAWLRKPERMHVAMNGACISPTITQVPAWCTLAMSSTHCKYDRPVKMFSHASCCSV